MHDQLPPITVKAAYEQQNFQYSYTLDSQPVAFAVPDPATAETFAVYTDRYGDPTLVSSDTLLGVSERSFENPPVWKNIRRDGETLTYRHLAYAETLYEKGQTSLSRIQY